MANISPILQYNFEQTGGTLTDLSNNNNNGTVGSDCKVITNDPTMGTCIEFAGKANSNVSFPDLPGTGVSDLTNGITITAWLNVANNDHLPCLLNFGNGSDQVAMPGVSAIQVLHAVVEEQKRKTQKLEQRMESLERENRTLRQERERI